VAEAIGIVVILAVSFLLFKEASQRTITTDIEIKVLNDLDDKLHDIPS